MVTVCVIVFGLIVGSFLNVCIFRIPHGRYPKEVIFNPPEGEEPTPERIENPNPEDLLTPWDPPRSFCPSCDKDLLWWHNIPLFSWLMLRGKCYFCKTPISARYPVVEALSAALAYLSYSHFGLSLTALIIYTFAATLVVISFIDYDYYIIPDVISQPGLIIGVLCATINQFFGIFPAPFCYNLFECALGLLAGAGFLYAVSWLYMLIRRKEGLGLGDVKLLAMTGAFFGPQAAIMTIFLGSLFGSLLGISLILILGKKMDHPLPFGPYLAVGTLLFLYVDQQQLMQFQLFLTRVAGG